MGCRPGPHVRFLLSTAPLFLPALKVSPSLPSSSSSRWRLGRIKMRFGQEVVTNMCPCTVLVCHQGTAGTVFTIKGQGPHLYAIKRQGAHLYAIKGQGAHLSPVRALPVRGVWQLHRR